MLVKDIIKIACSFTDNNELASALDGNSLTQDQTLIRDCLVNCFNLVNNEIASEYLPYLKSETIETDNFKINFTSFSEKLREIISIKDSYGNNVKYKVFESYVMVFFFYVTICYSFLPSSLSISSQFSSLLPERVFAYGIAREYYLGQALFDDADIWEKRFKNALMVLIRKKSEIVMPKRRWI